MAVHDEAYPNVTRGGQVRAKRREHHLRGISGVGFQLVSVNKVCKCKIFGSSIYSLGIREAVYFSFPETNMKHENARLYRT